MNGNQTGAPVSNEGKTEFADTLLYILIKYRNVLIGALIAIVIAGAGVFLWVRNQQERESEASLQLSRIGPYLDQGMYATAINGEGKNSGLKKIADDFSGTPSGSMASLLLANAYYATGNFDSALKAYGDVSIGNRDLAAAALAGAGACHFEKNRFGDAAKSYHDASEKAESTALKALYLAKEANCYRQSNQLAKAAGLYRNIIDNYPMSQGAAISQQSLWQISGKL
ncbi:MAG: tetratricopeptide repeat protein [Chlorobiaceae bacterium]|nr:tetratricopeptide repeat protein [Chlorobiaceae bacterium]NTV60479.1 tetratricopeptide repeat protein [Chlorobiaceae bacterium]